MQLKRVLKKEKATVRRSKLTLLRKFSVLIGGSAPLPMLSSVPEFLAYLYRPVTVGRHLPFRNDPFNSLHLPRTQHLLLLLIQAHIGHLCLFLLFPCSVLYLWFLFMSLKHVDQPVFKSTTLPLKLLELLCCCSAKQYNSVIL